MVFNEKVARAIHDLKIESQNRYQPLDARMYPEMQALLDSFYLGRIGIRMIIGQYLELRFQNSENTPSHVIGCIDELTCPGFFIYTHDFC